MKKNMKIEFHNVDDNIAKFYHKLKESQEINGIIIGFGDTDDGLISDQMITIDDSPVAFISVSQDESNDLTIEGFEVIASKRNQGIGKSIITCFQKKIKYNRVNLIPQNEDSLRFWEQCGFVAHDNGFNMFMEWEKKNK